MAFPECMEKFTILDSLIEGAQDACLALLQKIPTAAFLKADWMTGYIEVLEKHRDIDTDLAKDLRYKAQQLKAAIEARNQAQAEQAWTGLLELALNQFATCECRARGMEYPGSAND